jgi:hypothetical protein
VIDDLDYVAVRVSTVKTPGAVAVRTGWLEYLNVVGGKEVVPLIDLVSIRDDKTDVVQVLGTLAGFGLVQGNIVIT